MLTGGKGLPVAIKALPFDQSLACSGVHSDNLVGLDKGKITGRSTCLDISRMIVSLKAPGFVLHPIKIVGFACLITSSNSIPFSGEVNW